MTSLHVTPNTKEQHHISNLKSYFNKASHSKLYSRNVQVSYFNFSYETNVLTVFPIPKRRIRIFTVVQDTIYFDNQLNGETHEADPMGNDYIDSNHVDACNVEKRPSFFSSSRRQYLEIIRPKTEKLEEIYNDIPSTSTIYLKKVYKIVSLWIHGVNGTIIDVFLGTNLNANCIPKYTPQDTSFQLSHHQKSEFYNDCNTICGVDNLRNYKNELEYNNINSGSEPNEVKLKLSSSPPNTTRLKNSNAHLIEKLVQALLFGAPVEDLVTGKTIPRTIEDAKKSAERVENLLKNIDLSHLCRSWIYRKIDYVKHTGENESKDQHLPEASLDLKTSAMSPCPRSGHQIQSYKDSLFLFAGYTGKEELEDCWEYRIKTQTWHLISQQCSKLGGITRRSCHQSTLHKDFVYFFGRYSDGKSITTPDFYRFNLNTYQWELISRNTSIENGPPLIYDHQMCTVHDQIFIFGGRIVSRSHEATPNSCIYEQNYSGLYRFDIKSGLWTCIQQVCNIKRQQIFLSDSTQDTCASGQCVDIHSFEAVSSQPKHQSDEIHDYIVTENNPLHVHVGHAMVYNPKTNSLLLISSGVPRQQNSTSFLQASRRQVLAFELDTGLVFDLTATSKLAHIPYTGNDQIMSEIPSVETLREAEAVSKAGWPPYHHHYFSSNSNSNSESQNSSKNGKPSISHPHPIFRTNSNEKNLTNNQVHENIQYLMRKYDGLIANGNLDLYRVELTQHQCVLDTEHQELYIYETLIFDSITAAHGYGYAYSTLWMYSIEEDVWLEIDNFNHPCSTSLIYQDLKSLNPDPLSEDECWKNRAPQPRFSTQFIYNENSNRFYLYGGNPGIMSQPYKKLGDLYSWTISLPTEDQIRDIILFFIYRQIFLELDPSRVETVQFFQEYISKCLRNVQDVHYHEVLSQSMHQLSIHLLAKEVTAYNLQLERIRLVQDLHALLRKK